MIRQLFGATVLGVAATVLVPSMISNTRAAAMHPGLGETQESVSVHRPDGRLRPTVDPFSMISAESLLASLEDLTAIRAHAGWRHSTSTGEVQAIAYMEDRLARLGFLRALGLEVEQEHFRTFLGIEFRETRVHLRVGGTDVEVPADASAGHREIIALARRFDSDGQLNDSDPDPVVVEGGPLLVRSTAEILALSAEEVAGRVVFLDFAVIDRVLNSFEDAVTAAWELAERQPAGIVIVTTFSNVRGESHGTFAGDGPAFNWVEVDPLPPVLMVRLEDLDIAGVDSWSDLEDLESVRLTWDVDIFSPDDSSLLIARIPGLDASRAVILGAHIDSPNSPGALDNGSGSVALLEVAQTLDRARITPPVDLYLVWFGSHERGIYGSSNFVCSHSELLDRSLAMLQMDCLSHPMDDLEDFITLEAWSYGRFGDGRILWPDFLETAAAGRGIATEPVDYFGLVSDNSSFGGLDVPNANLIYMNPYDIWEVHYDNHMHDPYDTVELAEEESDVFENMARVLMSAALETADGAPRLRVTPEPDRRALFVASHTEAPHMTPAGFTDFGMALAWEGFDVDVVPYGRHLTAADLENTELVVVLPVHDYPSEDADISLYDEDWSTAEVDALEAYVQDGGMIVLANSAHRLKYSNFVYEANEDWSDANAVGERFGVDFYNGTLVGSEATAVGDHELMNGVTSLALATDNAVPYTIDSGERLAANGTRSVMSLVESGDGEVLVMADLGILGNRSGEPQNLVFWRNLASYARNR